MKPDSDGIIRTHRVTIADYMARSSKDARTKESELTKQAKRADAVISGTIVRRYSAIDPTHTFLYSDWIATVGRVYKNASTVQVGSEIVVTREGGDLILDGQRIIDADPLFPEFVLSRKYVFFLRALQDTASFRAVGGWTFDITGTTPILLVDPHDPTELKQFSSGSTTDFLAALEENLKQ